MSKMSGISRMVSMMLISVSAIAQERFTNSIGMEFVLVKPGTMRVGEFEPPYPVPADTVKGAQRPYIMGFADGQRFTSEDFKRAKEQAERDASPGFEVQLKKEYYIGVFEVTQEQWKKVMGESNNPSVFAGIDSLAIDSHPVDNVTWMDAQRFIARLNRMERNRAYRLPTEFEWEYAARAGADKDIPWEQIREVAQIGLKTTQPVGQKHPNAWGLYDMLGNVWEWVSDYYNEKTFPDAVPPSKGKEHVLKGASIAGDVKNATYMTHAAGPGNGWDVGFRVVVEIK